MLLQQLQHWLLLGAVQGTVERQQDVLFECCSGLLSWQGAAQPVLWVLP